MIRLTVLVLISLFGHAATALAQGELLLGAWAGLGAAAVGQLVTHNCCTEANVGSTVRFRDGRTGVRSITGVVRAIDADSVTVAVGDSLWRGPLAAMQGLRAQTTERKWAQGWLVGLVTGTTLGTVIGAATPTEPNDDFSVGRETLVIVGAAGGAVVGSVLGTLIGSATAGPHWQTVRQSRLSTTLLVSPGTKRVGFRVSFH
jgi:hypothetical protein